MIRPLVSLLLWVLSAVLLVVGVAGLIATATGKTGGAGGLIFVFLLALCTGSGAWTVARGGRRVTAALGPATAAPVTAVRGLQAGIPAASKQVRYAERCSQFLLVRSVIAVCLLAGGAAGTAVAGPQSVTGGIWLTVATLCGIYVFFLLADLPNGIRIEDGRFSLGVRGVPPAGRLWRRISGPLDAVYSWHVHVPEQRPRQPGGQNPGSRRPGSRRPGGQNPGGRRRAGPQPQRLGDLRLFSRRRFLRLVVDPASVQARLPSRVLVGYLFVDAARAGARWDGVIVIGTRHAAALTAALEQAIPGRRETVATAAGASGS